MRPASDIIAEVSAPVIGLPLYLSGSLVAEETYGMTAAHDDADIFTPTQQTLIAAVQTYLGAGYTLDDRMSRVWQRWLRHKLRWHTNSIKLTSPLGTKVNLVYKLVDDHPTTSLSQVLESFDFGLLGVGYDLEHGLIRRDLRAYLFEGMDPMGPLPLMPNKRTNWRAGFISRYNGLREAGRYAKYATYGYDLSLVKDDLITGYWAASAYLSNKDMEEERMRGKIYEALAIKIEDDEIDEITTMTKELIYLDDLDKIMEALE